MKMTKKVNINAPIAVRTVTPPIYGTVKGIFMTTGDILKCLCKRARIEEILPNGNLVNLTMKNYFTDNGAGLDAEATYAALEKKSANPINNGLSFANNAADANNVESDDELDVTETEPDAAEQENFEVEPDATEQEVLTDDTAKTDAEYVEAQPVEEVVANDVVDDAAEVTAEPEIVETEPDAAEVVAPTADTETVEVENTDTEFIQVSPDVESVTETVEVETPVVETTTVEKKKTSSKKRSTSSKK